MSSAVNQLDLRSRPLILGTSSKFRHAVFREHFPNVPFSSRSASIKERALNPSPNTPRELVPPQTLTLFLAHAKADALMEECALPNDALLVTCDQVVTWGGKVREKPVSEEECRMFLRSYTVQPLVTVSAVVVVDVKTGKRLEGVDTASQAFTEMPEEVVNELIRKGDVMWCSGGITVEDPLLERYLGERKGELDSIMGLPVRLLGKLLKEIGT